MDTPMMPDPVPPYPLPPSMVPMPPVAWETEAPKSIGQMTLDELLISYANVTSAVEQGQRELDWVTGRVRDDRARARKLHDELLARIAEQAHRNADLYQRTDDEKKEASR